MQDRVKFGISCVQGPGHTLVQFCVASILATLVLDDAAMDLVNTRNECHLVFESCLSLLGSTLQTLKSLHQPDPEDQDAQEQRNQQTLSVRLCEGCAQALWGSAYYCTLDGSETIRLESILKLSEIGLDCVNSYKVGILWHIPQLAQFMHVCMHARLFPKNNSANIYFVLLLLGSTGTCGTLC